MTVFLATPVMRTVERTELPSTRQLMTLARCSEVSLFILVVCQTAHALSRLLKRFAAKLLFDDSPLQLKKRQVVAVAEARFARMSREIERMLSKRRAKSYGFA